MKSFLKSSIIFIIFALVLPLNAQQFYWGLIGGINLTRIHPDIPNVIDNGISQEFSTRQRIGIGGVFGLSLGDGVFLQTEPMYLQKGGALAGEIDLFIKYSTLEIPLLLKLTFGKKIQPYIFFGPVCSVLLNSQWIFTIEEIALNGDAKNISRTFDFGVVMGTGISFPLGKGSVFLNCRYHMGLANLIKAGTIELEWHDFPLTVDISEGEEITSEGFQILVGFSFPLGKSSSKE